MKDQNHKTAKRGARSVHPIVGPSQQAIKRRLKELRVLIDTSKDPAERRVAYGMECAIRWAREETAGWEAPAILARNLAKMLRHDMLQHDIG